MVPRPACQIRPATRQEIPEIEDLMVAAYAEYASEVPPPVFEAYVEDLRRLAQHWDEATVLVAELGGRIAGSVLFYADASDEGVGLPRGWAGFRKLAVHPHMRGRRVGHLLVAACIHRARRLRSPAIVIHTASFMKAARLIYERLGFERMPEFDLTASQIAGATGSTPPVPILAYRLNLAGSATSTR